MDGAFVKVAGRAIQAVTFVFAAFSSFLLKIAPPKETKAEVAVGLALFISLIVYLFVLVAVKRLSIRTLTWVSVTLALACGVGGTKGAINYSETYQQHVLPFPYDEPLAPEWKVSGLVLTPVAVEFRKKRPPMSDAELLTKFGGKTEAVWISESIDDVRQGLVRNYLIAAVGLASAVFWLVELLIVLMAGNVTNRGPGSST